MHQLHRTDKPSKKRRWTMNTRSLEETLFSKRSPHHFHLFGHEHFHYKHLRRQAGIHANVKGVHNGYPENRSKCLLDIKIQVRFLASVEFQRPRF